MKRESQPSTPLYAVALRRRTAKNSASTTAPKGKSLKQEGGGNRTGRHGTKNWRETVGVDLREGAGEGEKSRKVTIEGQGGGAGNDVTAPPGILDQAPGRALKDSEGGGNPQIEI